MQVQALATSGFRSEDQGAACGGEGPYGQVTFGHPYFGGLLGGPTVRNLRPLPEERNTDPFTEPS